MRHSQSCSPWCNDSKIAAATQQRNWLQCKALKSELEADWSFYRKIHNKVARPNLGTHLSHDSQKFWRSFQHLSSRQKAQFTIVDTSRDTINQHFLTIAQKTVADLPSSSVSPLSYIDCVNCPFLKFSLMILCSIFKFQMFIKQWALMGYLYMFY